jgi:hypothetical protein
MMLPVLDMMVLILDLREKKPLEGEVCKSFDLLGMIYRVQQLENQLAIKSICFVPSSYLLPTYCNCGKR